MSQKRAFFDFYIVCMQCRDLWDSTSPNAEIRDKPYSDFIEWVLEVGYNDEPPDAVSRLLTIFVSGSDYSLHEKEDMRTKMKETSYRRNYRVVRGADIGAVDGDSRVRDLMSAIIEATVTKPKVSQITHIGLVTQFFADRRPLKNKKGKENGYTTLPCSRFEQVIYLVAISHLSNILTGRRAQKRRKGNNGRTVPRLSSISSIQQHIGQRVGCAIQMIVHGWNQVARHLKFANVEEMVLPYSRLVGFPLKCEVVTDRGKGFVPKSQLTGLEVNVSLTLQREETFEEAFDRGEDVDKHLRMLVSEFFEYIFSVILAEDLYTGPEDTQWVPLHQYAAQQEAFTGRFARLPQRALEVVMAANNGRPEIIPELCSRPRRMGGASLKVKSGESNVGSKKKAPAPRITPEEESLVPAMSEKELTKDTETLQEAAKPFWRMYACSFSQLIEAEDTLYGGEGLLGKVQLGLTDPPYNIRRRRGSKNSSYDVLTLEQMTETVDLIAQLLRKGGHCLLYCSIQQFALWEQKFKAHESGPERKKQKTFSVDSVALNLVKDNANNSAFPGRMSCSLQSSAEYIIHAFKTGLSLKEMLAKVNFRRFNFVQSDHEGWNNVINNIKGCVKGERIRVPTGENGKMQYLRCEQKPIALSKELICRFTQPGDLVLDGYTGTCPSGVGCFEVPKHRVFVGCDKDATCWKYAMENALKRLSAVVTGNETDIRLSEAGQKAAERLCREFRRPKKGDAKWKAPHRFPGYQSMPRHVIAQVASVMENVDLLATLTDKGVHDWPSNCQAALHQMNVESLRSIEASVCGLMVAPSRIKHGKAGLGVFAARSISRGERIASYYGTLVYHNLYNRGETEREYGEGILSVSVARFKKYALQLRTNAETFARIRDYLDGRKAVSIVPAPFCVASFIDDWRYDGDDLEFDLYEKGDLPHPRKQNVQFCNDLEEVESICELNPHGMEYVEATRFINAEEELNVSYGNSTVEFTQQLQETMV